MSSGVARTRELGERHIEFPGKKLFTPARKPVPLPLWLAISRSFSESEIESDQRERKSNRDQLQHLNCQHETIAICDNKVDKKYLRAHFLMVISIIQRLQTTDGIRFLNLGGLTESSVSSEQLKRSGVHRATQR